MLDVKAENLCVNETPRNKDRLKHTVKKNTYTEGFRVTRM